jgi:hypothetical protein
MFLKTLLTKMLIGLSTLFLSIATNYDGIFLCSFHYATRTIVYGDTRHFPLLVDMMDQVYWTGRWGVGFKEFILQCNVQVFLNDWLSSFQVQYELLFFFFFEQLMIII